MKLPYDLNNMVTLAGKNFLSLNTPKTQTIIIGFRSKLKHLSNITPLRVIGKLSSL